VQSVGANGVLRRPFLFFLVFAIFFCGSLSSEALAGDARWLSLSPQERALVDRVAADLYESSLSRPDARTLEQLTSRAYASGAPVDRARFRAFRREEWRALSPAERAALRAAKQPVFRNLTTGQKAPFRRQALDMLGVGQSAVVAPTYGRDI
ncbi:MAG: hypothetical protein AAGJ87_02495, partial [Pseudomonadota bacterium]